MEKTKNITILYERDDWRKKIPFHRAKYRNSYEIFYKLALENNLRIIRSSYHWFTKKGFKKGWTFDSLGWEKTGAYRPELIYDKCRLTPKTLAAKEEMARHFLFLNPPKFDLITSDKFITYLFFAELSPKTFFFKKTDDLSAILKSIPGARVVVKPVIGSGGKKIIFPEKERLLSKKIVIEPESIIQEFIDSSSGIPGLIGGTHDLRVVVIDDKISYGYLRTPVKGSLLCNISQGGKMHNIKISQIPKTIFPYLKKIQQTFSVFGPLVYSADFAFNQNQQPLLIEINSMPGMYFDPGTERPQAKVYQEILDLFKKILKTNHEIINYRKQKINRINSFKKRG